MTRITVLIQCLSLGLGLVWGAGPLAADPPVIEAVSAVRGADGAWRFDVTLSHADTGWDDYADGWRVETPDGSVLGTRALLHPHVQEQPFTRSLSGVAVPDETTEVLIRARDIVGGWAETGRVFPLTE